MILHHYEPSPFAELIRSMLAYAGVEWQSCLSPPMPPRPIADPLTGGYRRIPIAQIGADIFCDTRIISAEIARLSSIANLSYDGVSAEESEFATYVNSDVFQSVAINVHPPKVLFPLFKRYGFRQLIAFIKDRVGMSKTATMKPKTKPEAIVQIQTFKQTLETKLATSDFLFGSSPSIADFSAYQVAWFAQSTNKGEFLKGYPKANAWFEKMSSFDKGNRQPIDKNTVWHLAKTCTPRDIPAAMQQHANIGKTVSVAPADYGRNPVTGTLVGLDETRIILARQTGEFGLVHVHFPVVGYELVLQ